VVSESFTKKIPILLANCENRLIGKVRLHRLVELAHRGRYGSFRNGSTVRWHGLPMLKGFHASFSPSNGPKYLESCSEGMKNNGHKERQYDVIAKSIILSFISDGVFNRVFACKNSFELWKTINENHGSTKDVANERYHVLIDKLNSFKQFDNEDASSLYSRLNLLVNEVNSLDVKKIEELELICKILHSLRRPDYDLVTTILYEKELKTMTPNQVLNKVIAHELRNGIKPREPPSSPTHSALASKQAKMLKKMVIQESSSDEEEEDAAKSSSSEKEEMDRKLLKEAKIMNKSLKKINMMGYMIFLKDGHHHQLMKVKRNKYKKNNQGKKDKKPKHEALSIFGVWVSGGEESSTSSSDESIKRFTTRTNIGASSLNMCLMSKGMESDVSDDDSDSPSFEDLLELIHEQQRVMKRQAKEIKQLNAFNDLNASLATNYDDLW
jgi:hypothetical protein